MSGAPCLPLPRRRRRGLGMVEMLVSLAIMAALLSAVAAAYSATTTAVEMNDQFFRASQAARVSINQIVAEVRKCQSGLVDADSLELTPSLGEKRVYAYDVEGKRLTMTFPDRSVPTTYVLARNVDAAEFFTDGETISLRLTVQIGSNRITLSGSAMPRRSINFD
jgi:prepilin-type N-terminal cleavage/methylation domain-containing protein